MMYTVIPTEQFIKDVEYYRKKKKFVHITDDISNIVSKLEQGNLIGDELQGIQAKASTSNKSYKVRVANSDTKVGKSNGYRLIYYAITDDLEIYLLTIYYKKDDNDIPTENEIVGIIQSIGE